MNYPASLLPTIQLSQKEIHTYLSTKSDANPLLYRTLKLAWGIEKNTLELQMNRNQANVQHILLILSWSSLSSEILTTVIMEGSLLTVCLMVHLPRENGCNFSQC